MTSLGRYCDEAGVTADNLLDRLPQMEMLNNGQVYEIIRYVQSAKLPWSEVRSRMRGAENMTVNEFCPAMARE